MNCLGNDLLLRLQLRWYLLLTTMKGLLFNSILQCMISTKTNSEGFSNFYSIELHEFTDVNMQTVYFLVKYDWYFTNQNMDYDLLSKIIWQDVSQWHEKLLIISDVVLAHKSNVTLFVTFLNALCCYFHTLLFGTTVNLQFSRGKYSYYISGYVLCNIIIVRKSLS